MRPQAQKLTLLGRDGEETKTKCYYFITLATYKSTCLCHKCLHSFKLIVIRNMFILAYICPVKDCVAIILYLLECLFVWGFATKPQ